MAVGVLILAFVGSRLGVSYRTTLSGCARENGTGGASGLFRWAGRIGIPVRLLEVPIWEDPQALQGHDGHCLVTMGDGSWSAMGEEPTALNWQVARKWISRGNTLIIVTDKPANLPRALRMDLRLSAFNQTGGASASSPASALIRGSVDSKPETTRAPVASGGALTVEQNGPRWSIPPAQAPGAGATGTSPPPSSPENDPAGWQLAGDGQGGVLFRIPVGAGAVYVLLDDFAWTNAGFDQGDNARVLADVLDREVRGGVLAFDEYRHGHGRAESFLAYLLNLPGLSGFMWLAAIWGLLYVYGRNVRLGPAEAYVERERRTAQEAIDAVAQLYERARAAPLVVEAVARRLRQVSRSSAALPPDVDELLRKAEDYTNKEERPVSPSAAIRLVRELIQLRKRVYGTRTVS
jgi:hypothetical protein